MWLRSAKIVEGRVAKTVSRGALLEQPFIRDTNKTVNDVVTEVVAKLGENIKIRRFERSAEAPVCRLSMLSLYATLALPQPCGIPSLT